tara:strand:+ start:175 stop:432 length:258 start_codon:yes stop_codon:yes gene_type:complete
MKKLDPRKYGLSPRIKLFQNIKREVFLEIDRKSRVVMKDGLRIFDIAEKVKGTEQQSSFFLITSAPVCSKTKLYLKGKNINIKPK